VTPVLIVRVTRVGSHDPFVELDAPKRISRRNRSSRRRLTAALSPLSFALLGSSHIVQEVSTAVTTPISCWRLRMLTYPDEPPHGRVKLTMKVATVLGDLLGAYARCMETTIRLMKSATTRDRVGPRNLTPHHTLLQLAAVLALCDVHLRSSWSFLLLT
jgi:hypothetical protein